MRSFFGSGTKRVSIACFESLECRRLFAVQYVVDDLGLGGAYGINTSGQVVGEARNLSKPGDPPRAFRTSSGGTINAASYLGTLGGNFSYAVGINSTGQTTGYSNTSDGVLHAFRTTATGNMSTASVFAAQTFAFGINDAGQVVGRIPVGTLGDVHAFRTAANGTNAPATDLGTLGGHFSQAVAINASGQTVGSSSLSAAASHAYRTTANGKITASADLGTLGGSESAAFGINAVGQVVGSSATSAFQTHAFCTTATGKITAADDLGTLGGTLSQAIAINDSGQIVGYSMLAGDAVQHAFLYADGKMIDLNATIPATSGWVLQYAAAINSSGQIVGYGTLNGQVHAFRLGSSFINEPKIAPDLAKTLHINQVFGTEELDVPLNLTGLWTTGTVKIELALSLTNTGSPALNLPVDQLTYTSTTTTDPVHPGDSVKLAGTKSPLAVIARAKVPTALTAGMKYYIFAKITISATGWTEQGWTSGTYEFVGNPGAKTAPNVFGGTSPLYLKFLSDLVKTSGTVWPSTYSGVATDTTPTTFFKIAEGERLDPYLDTATPQQPTIGIGININALSFTLTSDLVKAVRDFFANPDSSVVDDWISTSTSKMRGTTTITAATRDTYLAISAAYLYDPTKAPISLANADDAQIITMLKNWAAGSPPIGVVTNGTAKTNVQLAVHDKAISNHSEIRLFNTAFNEHLTKIQSSAELGMAAWQRINGSSSTTVFSRAAVAVMSFFYNVGSFNSYTSKDGAFHDGWPGLKSALQSTSGPNRGPDYLAAAFQLVNALRTTQIGSSRTEAEVEDLLFNSKALVGNIIT